jgi:hypothetical protein
MLTRRIEIVLVLPPSPLIRSPANTSFSTVLQAQGRIRAGRIQS